MKNFLSILLVFFMAFIFLTFPVMADTGEAAAVAGENDSPNVGAEDASKNITMYRMYNPNSGEHFYTAALKERNNLISAG